MALAILSVDIKLTDIKKMKITIVFAVLVVILASDLVFGVPVQRQTGWDLFPIAMEWFDDAGDQISETADKSGDLAESTIDPFEEFGNDDRESLDRRLHGIDF